MRLLAIVCAMLLLLPWIQSTQATSHGRDAKMAVTKRQSSCPWRIPFLLTARRTPDCTRNVWNSYPSRCEALYDLLPSASTAAQVRTLLETLCASECVRPVVQYPECFSLSRANVSLVTNGYCGRQNGEFCPVLVYLNEGVQLCRRAISDCTDVNLASTACTPSTCPSAWRAQANYYGCCYWGYLRAFGFTNAPPKFTGCGGIPFPQMCASSAGKEAFFPVLLMVMVSVVAAAV